MMDQQNDYPLMSADGVRRCFGTAAGQHVLARYHDEERGVPVHDDRHLFEMLPLEGAQAGLSWDVVLRKRVGYRAAFHDFDVDLEAVIKDSALLDLRNDPGIVRNRIKVASVRSNAEAILTLRQRHGSLDAYLWGFVDGQPVINRFASISDVSASTPLSDQLSKDMKRRGFSFVGNTIIYAFTQGIGMVNDHVEGCWRRSDMAR